MIGSPTWKCQQDLHTLEAARFGLLGDISAILKGSQLSPRDRDKLMEHLRQTDVLLSAAKLACQEILSSMADTPK
jgi:hypothetical protein